MPSKRVKKAKKQKIKREKKEDSLDASEFVPNANTVLTVAVIGGGIYAINLVDRAVRKVTGTISDTIVKGFEPNKLLIPFTLPRTDGGVTYTSYPTVGWSVKQLRIFMQPPSPDWVAVSKHLIKFMKTTPSLSSISYASQEMYGIDYIESIRIAWENMYPELDFDDYILNPQFIFELHSLFL